MAKTPNHKGGSTARNLTVTDAGLAYLAATAKHRGTLAAPQPTLLLGTTYAEAQTTLSAAQARLNGNGK